MVSCLVVKRNGSFPMCPGSRQGTGGNGLGFQHRPVGVQALAAQLAGNPEYQEGDTALTVVSIAGVLAQAVK
jgi:hypothetical protein